MQAKVLDIVSLVGGSLGRIMRIEGNTIEVLWTRDSLGNEICQWGLFSIDQLEPYTIGWLIRMGTKET